MKQFFLLLIYAASVPTFAKIADPEGVYENHRLYCTHGNMVTAYKAKDKNADCDNIRESEVVWRTELPYRVGPLFYFPGLERDVQLCILGGVSLTENEVKTFNCRNQHFVLDKKSGKQVK